MASKALAISQISTEQFVQMVCGEEPFSVEFVRKEKQGKWTWEVQLNMPSEVLEKAFLRLFEEYIFMPEPADEAQVSMTIPPKLVKAHFNVRFDFQNAFFLKSAQRRLRDEYIRALESWLNLQRILAKAWEDGLLKAAVEDGKRLEEFDRLNRFEISLYREAMIERLKEVLGQIAAGSFVSESGGMEAHLGCPKIPVCLPVKNDREKIITDQAGSVISLWPEVFTTSIDILKNTGRIRPCLF